MSKYLVIAIFSLLVVSISSNAGAWTAKWCFHWQGSYDDAGFGEDYLNVDDAVGTNEIGAKYAYTIIYKKVGSIWESPPLWQDWLDSTGCTDNVEVLAGTTYRFYQYLKVQRGTRLIEVHPDGVDWDGYPDHVVTDMTTPNPMPALSSYDAPLPADTTNNRLMPAVTQVLSLANTLDFPDGVDIDMSTDDDATAWGASNDCGSWTESHGTSHYHICISDHWSHSKYNIAHEFGHDISKENDGPHDGDYTGSEGTFNGGAICDCSVTGGYSHCPTSREFAGSGHKDGFSHFIATAAYNIASEDDGIFVFYKDLHEPTADHYDDFPDMLENPAADRGSLTYHPVESTTNTSSNLKWVNYECDPGSTYDVWLRGNEWDWLEFYWNLYTDGASTYTVPEINDVWEGTGSAVSLCCDAEDECNSFSVKTSTCVSPRPYEHVVGKMWADLRVEAAALYGTTKGNNFYYKGVAAGVSAY